MQFDSHFLDNLRSRITISQVVGRRVRLTRRGREYLGLCPFHNEKSPSFSVNDEKGFYHCFGCGAHGDAIRFLMETAALGYVEAITQLAQDAGLPLPKPDKKAAIREQHIASLHDIMEMACKYYQTMLMSHEGRHAREYLRGRGIGEVAIRTFRIGYAPDQYTALKNVLGKQSVPESSLRAAGLLTEKEGKESYDKFRNRIIFPITDSRNRVVAFGGRILGDGMPKYLNSPETELFRKGEMLYNLALAREAAYQTQEMVVAEGYMDVIALHMAGITHAVAPLGTAITESQLSLLWRYAKEPTLCLDGDNAGKRAMVKAATLALPLLKPGFSLKFSVLPEGMDPDDVIREEGPEAIRRYIAHTSPLSETLWFVESAKRRVTPEQKAALEEKLKAYALQIRDKTVQNYYRKFFSEKLWQWSREGIRKQRGYVPAVPINMLATTPMEVDQIRGCEQTLLALMIYHPEILYYPEVEEELSYINFISETLDKLCTSILEIKNFASSQNSGRLCHTSLMAELEAKGFSAEVSRLLKIRQGFWEEFLSTDVDVDTAILGWQRAVMVRNLALMQAERRKACVEVTEESLYRAEAIRKQMEEIERLLHTDGD